MLFELGEERERLQGRQCVDVDPGGAIGLRSRLVGEATWRARAVAAAPLPRTRAGNRRASASRQFVLLEAAEDLAGASGSPLAGRPASRATWMP